jgi:hypothetical protein
LSGTGDGDADRLVGRIMDRAGGSVEQVAALEKLLLDLMTWRPRSPPPRPLGTAEELADAVAEFLQPENPLPEWFDPTTDPQRIDRAQVFFGRYRLTALVILGSSSLPHCYCDREISATLISSGRLASQVTQRLADTADFLTAVMERGSLGPGGQGPAWIRKVRLMHALMRQLTLQNPNNHLKRDDNTLAGFLLRREWNKPDLMPIDQVELSFVLLTFSLVLLKGWQSLGITIDSQLQHDYLFTWAVIGHILGVHDELLPRSAQTAMREAEALFTENKRSEPGTREGRLLIAALQVLLIEFVLHDAQTFPLPRWLSWTRPILMCLARTLPRSLIRELIGSDTATALWVEPAPFLQRFPHWVLIRALALREKMRTQSRPERVERGIWTDFGMHVERLCVARRSRARGDDTRPPSAAF